MYVCLPLGKGSVEKTCFLSGIAQVSRELVLFSKQNSVLSIWQKKSTNGDNDDYNKNDRKNFRGTLRKNVNFIDI